MDLYERVTTSMVEHWPLVLAFAGAGYYAFKKMLPAGVKLSLMNGSGEVVRGIVRAENDEQRKAVVAEVEAAVKRLLGEHEGKEQVRFEAIEARVMKRKIPRR